ncbi:hypothetical protein GN956_G19732 [Arapaima gigas]
MEPAQIHRQEHTHTTGEVRRGEGTVLRPQRQLDRWRQGRKVFQNSLRSRRLWLCGKLHSTYIAGPLFFIDRSEFGSLLSVMDGVLETAVALGLCKVACSLLFLPAVRASSSSVSLCCNCLLLFTDLAVTAFLALLWLVGSWLLPVTLSSDTIALRFLLFLGHTYSEVLLLTIPFIAVETACRLQWPLAGRTEKCCAGPQSQNKGRGGWRRYGDMERLQRDICTDDPVDLDCGECGGWGSEVDTGLKEEKRHRESLLHISGFFCCLLIWVLCSLCSGPHWGPETQCMEACLLASGSLSTCLPKLSAMILPAVRDPSVTLFSLALLVAMALVLRSLRKGLTHSKPCLSGLEAGKSRRAWKQRHQTATGAVVVTLVVFHQAQAADTEGASYGHSCHGSDGCCPLLSTDAGLQDDSSSLFAPLHWGLSPHTCSKCIFQHVALALDSCCPHTAFGPHLMTHTEQYAEYLCRTQVESRGRYISCFEGQVITGLVCGITLYFIPPAMSVNTLLIRSVEGLVERILRYLQSTYRERIVEIEI